MERQCIGRNVHKTKESSLLRVMTAASILLNGRNRNMNSHQVHKALTLKAQEGAAKKSTFKGLNARKKCSSYDTTLKMQLDCGTNYDNELKQWAAGVHEDNVQERMLRG